MPETNPKKLDSEINFICPTVYCEHCKRDVEFLVHRTRRCGLYHGVRYRYKGKKANCRECGHTVILPEIMEYNFRKLIAESKKDKYKENENDDS